MVRLRLIMNGQQVRVDDTKGATLPFMSLNTRNQIIGVLVKLIEGKCALGWTLISKFLKNTRQTATKAREERKRRYRTCAEILAQEEVFFPALNGGRKKVVGQAPIENIFNGWIEDEKKDSTKEAQMARRTLYEIYHLLLHFFFTYAQESALRTEGGQEQGTTVSLQKV